MDIVSASSDGLPSNSYHHGNGLNQSSIIYKIVSPTALWGKVLSKDCMWLVSSQSMCWRWLIYYHSKLQLNVCKIDSFIIVYVFLNSESQGVPFSPRSLQKCIICRSTSSVDFLWVSLKSIPRFIKYVANRQTHTRDGAFNVEGDKNLPSRQNNKKILN